MSIKSFRVRIALFLATAVLTACGGASNGGAPQVSSTPLTVLGFLSTTGAAASFKSVGPPPSQLAIDYINKNGGINGRKLALQTVDSQLVPAQAVNNYQAYSAQAVALVMVFSG